MNLRLRRRHAATVILVALASSTASAKPRERHVLIAADAWLYTAPKETAPKVRLAGERAPGTLVPFRLVSEKSGWLTVETVDEPEPAVDCYPAIATLADYRVTFAVRAADRAKVTGKALAHTFADGSQVALHAGVGLSPTSEGRVRIAVGQLGFEVALPAGAAADSYRAEPVADAPVFSRVLAPGKPITLDGRAVTVKDKPTAEDAGEGKVRIATRCAELVAQGKSVLPAMAGGATGGDTDLAVDLAPFNRYLPAGKAVLFADGKPAGKTRREIAVDDFTAQGKLLCQTIALAPGAAAERNLTLCVRPKDVKVDKSRGQVDDILGEEKVK